MRRDKLTTAGTVSPPESPPLPPNGGFVLVNSLTGSSSPAGAGTSARGGGQSSGAGRH
jgi:hypothetical protein